MPEQRFTARVEATGGSAYVDLPFDVPAAFGTNGRVSLKGTINGHPFATSTSPRHGHWYFVVNRQMRSAFGVGPGDTVEVTVDRDDEPRSVEAPADLAAALSGAPDAEARWEAMSYSHRKQYVAWVEEAKRPDTRARRVERSLGMIARGERRQ